jgi:hypothetical protein
MAAVVLEPGPCWRLRLDCWSFAKKDDIPDDERGAATLACSDEADTWRPRALAVSMKRPEIAPPRTLGIRSISSWQFGSWSKLQIASSAASTSCPSCNWRTNAYSWETSVADRTRRATAGKAPTKTFSRVLADGSGCSNAPFGSLRLPVVSEEGVPKLDGRVFGATNGRAMDAVVSTIATLADNIEPSVLFR